MSIRHSLTLMLPMLLATSAPAQMACPPGMAPAWSGTWVCTPAGSAPGSGQAGPSREQQIDAIMSGARQGEMTNPMQGRVNAIGAMLEAQALSGQRLQAAIDADPRLRELAKGLWEHFDAGGSGRAAASCAAAYIELGGALLLAEVGGGFREAVMTFVGVGIPRPPQPSKVTATLDQDDGKPRAVKVLNFAVEGSRSLGAIAFEVPTMPLLLDAMADTQRLEVRMGDRSVVEVHWKRGHEARDRLRRCTNARR